MQTGLECIGDIDMYDIFEAVYLAAKSLDTISPDFVLDISHMGVLSAALDEVCDSAEFKKEIIALIGEKNPHEAEALCERYSIDKDGKERVCAFVNLHGNPEKVISKLESLCQGEKSKSELNNLKELCALIDKTEYAKNVRIDFSVLNDMSYYNGIVFKGFLEGIPEGVLSGGRYDKLMERMGRKSGAIGFALYLDLLYELETDKKSYDVDTLVLYSDSTDISRVSAKVNELNSMGISVTAQKAIPTKLRYRELVDLTKEGR